MINLEVLSVSVYIVSILCTIFLLVFWRLNQDVEGVALWFLSVLSQTLACYFFLYGNNAIELAQTFSIDSFLFLSVLLIYVGSRVFIRERNNKILFVIFALLYACSIYSVSPEPVYLSVVNFSFITVVTLLSIHSMLVAPIKYRTLGALLFSILCGLVIILSFTRLFDTLILNSSMEYGLELILMLVISSGLTFFVFIFCHEKRLIELLTLKRELKEEIEIKNHYLVTFSHELRTPLNAMVGLAQLMKVKLLDKALINDCDIIIESGQSLSNLATSILDYSSFEAKEGLSLNIENVSLFDITHSILALLRPLAQEKGLLLQTNISKQVDDFVELDKNKFRQILINLLGNAIKYTDKGSVTLSLEVKEVLTEKISLRFSVEDTGIGVCESDQKKVLKPFHQAAKNTNTLNLTNNDGVGFGLAHTVYLLRLISSQLHIQSGEKKGSVFYFDLSLKKSIHTEDESFTESSSKAKSLNVLVVEDIVVNQKIIERMLLLESHHVTIAATGNEAILLLKEIRFDLVFLDMFLPDMHGLTLLQHINNDEDVKGKPKIIAVTASVTSEQIKTYEQSGIVQVVKKPIMKEALKEAVDCVYFNKSNHLPWSVQARSSQLINEKQYNKLLFNIKMLTFLKENLSVDEFMQVVDEVPTNIDKYINKVIFAKENNNDVEFIEELHRLAGFSAQIGLEQLCEKAKALQKSKKENPQENITCLLKLAELAKLSLAVFKEEVCSEL